jgi:hypothetical protein
MNERFATLDHLRALAAVRGPDYFTECVARGRYCPRRRGYYWSANDHADIRAKWRRLDAEAGREALVASLRTPGIFTSCAFNPQSAIRMKPPFFQRIQHAGAALFGGGPVAKSGAPFPFNKIMPYDATGGEKLYHPYEHSAWVMRAIKKISGPVSAVSLEFTRNGEAYEDAALSAWWEQPAVNLSRTDLFEATIGWLKLEGEAFWIMDDSWSAPFARARSPLILARPDRMNHIVKQGALAGWDYSDMSSSPNRSSRSATGTRIRTGAARANTARPTTRPKPITSRASST